MAAQMSSDVGAYEKDSKSVAESSEVLPSKGTPPGGASSGKKRQRSEDDDSSIDSSSEEENPNKRQKTS